MISTADVDRLEALYAQGQQAKAIRECRLFALTELPGHNNRVDDWVAKQKHSHHGDRERAEEYVYRSAPPPENMDAATVVFWCAKWVNGQPETQTTGGYGKGETRQTYVVSTRQDFAVNAFIALRRLAVLKADTQTAAPSVSAPLAAPAATPPKQRGIAQEEAVLAKIRELGHDPLNLPKFKHSEPGVKAKVRDELVGKNPLFPKKGTQFDKAWERLRKYREIDDQG